MELWQHYSAKVLRTQIFLGFVFIRGLSEEFSIYRALLFKSFTLFFPRAHHAGQAFLRNAFCSPASATLHCFEGPYFAWMCRQGQSGGVQINQVIARAECTEHARRWIIAISAAVTRPRDSRSKSLREGEHTWKIGLSSYYRPKILKTRTDAMPIPVSNLWYVLELFAI